MAKENKEEKKKPTVQSGGGVTGGTSDVDAQIFGGGEGGEAGGGTQPPVPPQEPKHSKTEGGKQTVTLSKEQFDSLLGRLSDLESGAMAREPKSADDVFNPLAEVKTDHRVRLAYHGDLLVVGYKPKVRPDGRFVYTFSEMDEETKQMRTKAILILEDENGKKSEEKVDMVAFLEGAVMLEGTIKERKDIGQVIDHGVVNQVLWDGTRMVDTGRKVMSGCKEQRFVYKIEHKGRIYEMNQEVINIK